MSYNFISLVNDVNGRLNEVPLTEANFQTASGWYVQAKEAVNSALMHISAKEDRLPFYYVSEELQLTPGQIKYGYPDEAESLKMDSFRIVKGSAGNIGAVYLVEGDWEQLLKEGLDMDSPTVKSGTPCTVFRYPSLDFGIYPPPLDTYTLKYEWYKLPARLDDALDVPDIPEQWRHVIINGAMMYAFMFRGDPDSSQLMQNIFEDGIRHIHRVYENRFVRVRDTRVRRT